MHFPSSSFNWSLQPAYLLSVCLTWCHWVMTLPRDMFCLKLGFLTIQWNLKTSTTNVLSWDSRSTSTKPTGPTQTNQTRCDPWKKNLNMNGPAPKPKIPPYLHRRLKSRTFPQLSHPDALDRQWDSFDEHALQGAVPQGHPTGETTRLLSSYHMYRVVFFNWPPRELAKCWPVSNRFRKNVRVPDCPPPPMIVKNLSVWGPQCDPHTYKI